MECHFKQCPTLQHANPFTRTFLKNPTTCPHCHTIYCSETCLRRDRDEYAHYQSCHSFKKGRSSDDNTSNPSSSSRASRRSLADYDRVPTSHLAATNELGRGSSGRVELVKDRATNRLHAMKIIPKRQILHHSTVEQVKREIKILKRIEHPHIIKLYSCFEDKENVYLVLEYAEKGPLSSYLRKKRRFSEAESFVFFFQTCLAIDYLHKKNIIHRDLKPENLLLDRNNDVKICDFGWSADVHDAKRKTFCGTMDYLAPEMILNKPHDASLDIWCLGILLFELLHGALPFKNRDSYTSEATLVIPFDSSLSPEAQNIITRMLRVEPCERLQMTDIFDHPWMAKHAQSFDINLWSFVYRDDKQSRPSNLSLRTGSTEDAGIFISDVDGLDFHTDNAKKTPLKEQYAKPIGSGSKNPLILANDAKSGVFSPHSPRKIQEKKRIDQENIPKTLEAQAIVAPVRELTSNKEFANPFRTSTGPDSINPKHNEKILQPSFAPNDKLIEQIRRSPALPKSMIEHDTSAIHARVDELLAKRPHIMSPTSYRLDLTRLKSSPRGDIKLYDLQRAPPTFRDSQIIALPSEPAKYPLIPSRSPLREAATLKPLPVLQESKHRGRYQLVDPRENDENADPNNRYINTDRRHMTESPRRDGKTRRVRHDRSWWEEILLLFGCLKRS